MTMLGGWNVFEMMYFVFFQEVKMYGVGNPYRVVAIDCGIKHNMIRHLVQVDLMCLGVLVYYLHMTV